MELEMKTVSEDEEQPTIKLARTFSKRLNGIVDEPRRKIEFGLDKRRRKWRKLSKRNKVLGPTPPILYKPVDEDFLREREDALYEYDDKVSELIKQRLSCCITARQIEQEKLHHQLEILQSSRLTLATRSEAVCHSLDVATTYSSHEETQQLLQTLSIDISDIKSLLLVKRMKFKTMPPQRPPLHSILQLQLPTGDSPPPCNSCPPPQNQQEEVSNIFTTLTLPNSGLEHAHYLYSDSESNH